MALGVGCLLSLLGVLYPALIAARMQPVEAMRVEQ
jgi:ABC-type lipoprotein release transport system permease subunit